MWVLVGPCGSLELFIQTPLPIRARREGTWFRSFIGTASVKGLRSVQGIS